MTSEAESLISRDLKKNLNHLLTFFHHIFHHQKANRASHDYRYNPTVADKLPVAFSGAGSED